MVKFQELLEDQKKKSKNNLDLESDMASLLGDLGTNIDIDSIASLTLRGSGPPLGKL